jgi:DNA invertase Pin-like site-specific DNA recombinase
LLDRLSRNLAFIATLMDSGTEFVAVDNPHANRLPLHIFAAVAQHEREMIAARTKAALSDRADARRLGRSFNMVELNSRANIDWRSRRRGCAVNTRSNPETLSAF